MRATSVFGAAAGAVRDVTVRRRAPRLVAMLAMTVAAATACPGVTISTGPGTTTTTTTVPVDPATNQAPFISTFTAARPTGASPLTTAFRWTVTDPDGNALTCTLDLDGNGTVDRTIQFCSSESLRSATYTAVGSKVVTLTVTDTMFDDTASTTVTTTAASADAFEITLRLNGSMTPTQEAAFTSAAARWSQAIRAGLATATLDIPADDCGTGAPAFNGSIDDVLIDATVAPIDGAGSILGQAGPCWIRNTGGLPMYGVMKFDTADVADLEADGDFGAVILHEMGHVLGFGTVWAGKGLVGEGSADPIFTGVTARGAWQAIGGTGDVPVENSGGSGTADSHWRESVFNGELMTGYIDQGNNPMSALTIAAFSDFGYGVDLGAADPYGLAGLRSEPAVDPTGADRLHTELVFPKGSA